MQYATHVVCHTDFVDTMSQQIEWQRDCDVVWLCPRTIAMSWDQSQYRQIFRIGRENASGGLNGRPPGHYWPVFAPINVTGLRDAFGGYYRERTRYCDTDVGA
jgi:hypothetical protein